LFSRDGTKILSLSSRIRRGWDGWSGVLQRRYDAADRGGDSSAIEFRADSRALAFIAAPIALSGNALPSVRVPYFGEVKLPWRAAGSGLANRSIQIVDLESGAATAIAVGQQTGLAAAVNVLTGTAQTISVPQPAAFSQLHFSADGRRLVGLISIAGQSSARIWSTVSGDEVCRIADPMMASSFSRAAFSPDGEWLATTSRQGLQDGKSIRLWDAATGRPGPELKGHASSVSSLAFNSDGKTLVSSDRLGVVKAWEISAPRTQRVGPYQLQRGRLMAPGWRCKPSAFTDDGHAINSRDEQWNQSLAVPGTLSFWCSVPTADFAYCQLRS
jgi:WD40 repeat protein